MYKISVLIINTKLFIINKSLLELDIFVCFYRLLKKHTMQICVEDKDHNQRF